MISKPPAASASTIHSSLIAANSSSASSVNSQPSGTRSNSGNSIPAHD